MGFQQDGDTITLTMTRDDYATLLLAIGIATGRFEEKDLSRRFIQLANTLNDGNPNWTPYAVDPPAKPS